MLPMLRRRHSIENPLDLFRRDFDVLSQDLSRVFGGWLPETPSLESMTAVYPVDMREEGDKLLVDAELPGFDKKDINVTLENGVLSISAERTEEEKKGKKHLDERRYTRIERHLAMPVQVDDAKPVAKFENGVLHLELKKNGESKAKKIAIS